jgi:hypothetical protein
MSLTGVNITFSDTARGMAQSPALLPSQVTGSQAMASPGTSSIKALGRGICQPLLMINASTPIFYAVGRNPDPTGAAGPRRYFDPAFGRYFLRSWRSVRVGLCVRPCRWNRYNESPPHQPRLQRLSFSCVSIVPASIACVTALTIIALIVVGAW